MCPCTTDHLWRTGQPSGIGSFHHVGLGDKIQVTRLDDTFATEPSNQLNPCVFGLTLIIKGADIFWEGMWRLHWEQNSTNKITLAVLRPMREKPYESFLNYEPFVGWLLLAQVLSGTAEGPWVAAATWWSVWVTNICPQTVTQEHPTWNSAGSTLFKELLLN